MINKILLIGDVSDFDVIPNKIIEDASIKKFTFDELELHRIEAACLKKNQRSLNTLKKNYFNIEGVAKKYLKINGKWQDHILLSCINKKHS